MFRSTDGSAVFCDCGRWTPDGSGVCKHHVQRPYRPVKRAKKFSGDSRWRQEMGQYQSKLGR